MSGYHIPVMLAETLEFLAPRPGSVIVDGTLGGGGHAREIAIRIAPGGTLVGLDQDPDAIAAATRSLAEVSNDGVVGGGVTVHLVRSNFVDIAAALDALGLKRIDGILLDLGVSSHQLDTPGRGFAFRLNGPLDMRMGPDVGTETAADLVNRLPEAEIADLFFTYGEEPRARRIASEIVRRRTIKPLETTEDLVDAVRGAMPMRTRPGEIHPATKVFQALRIRVNRELEVLERALDAAADRLSPGGRLVVIAYHSLEDRIVKNRFAALSGKREGSDLPDPTPAPDPILRILTKKPIGPGADEVRANPRARSAKLRAAERRPPAAI